MRRVHAKLETWTQLQHRLLDAREGLLAMRRHLGSRRPLPRHRKREQGLKEKLDWMLSWIDLTLGPPPTNPEWQREVAMQVWRFDEMRPAVVDAFVALLDETGERWPWW